MTFYIYILINPNTDQPFYVGQSMNPDARRYVHQLSAEGSMKYKPTPHAPLTNKYIYEHQIIPRLELVDFVETENRTDALRLENYWIWQFRSWGFELTNQRFVRKNEFPKIDRNAVKQSL